MKYLERMKRLLFLCIQFALSSILFGQDDSKPENSDFYKESLKIYVDYAKTLEPNIDTIYVRESYYLNDFTGIVSDVQIMMVNLNFITAKTSKRKTFPLIVINPMKLEEGTPIIDVVKFWVTRKRKKYHFANVYGAKVKVYFDCELETFVCEKIN